MEASELIDFNPWWSSGAVPERLLEDKHRHLFREILDLLPTRQIVSVIGLRRTGKTSLMYQVIAHLLEKGVPPQRILYFSFDKKISSVDELVKTYTKDITMEENIMEQSYLFLDEIQKLDDWEDQIKILYDRKLPLKILLSGSSSLTLESGGKETLAGRNYILRLDPLSFKEYIDLKGVDIPVYTDNERTYKKVRIQEEKFMALLHRSVRYQGLPETIDMDEELSFRYIRSSIIDQVIYKDIPSFYSVENPKVLEELLRVIAERPGMLLRYDSLASDLSRTRQTISNYVSYLERSFLLRLIYNYSGSFITSAKKLKKVYFAHPSLVSSMNPSVERLGMLMENQLINELGADFFHRHKGKEIDCILRFDDTLVPLEMKYSSNITTGDEKNLISFLDSEGLELGMMITRDTFDMNGRVLKVPMYYFLLYKDEIMKSLV